MIRSTIVRLNSRYGHLPWHRRYEFIGVFLSLYIIYALFLMPPAPLGVFNVFELVVTTLMYVALLATIQTDREKPYWLKNIVAVGFFVVLGWLFFHYSDARWAELNRYFFNWSIMARGEFLGSSAAASNNWQLMFRGLWIALQIFGYSLVLCTILALVLAVIRSIVNDVLFNFFIDAYIDLFRSAPPIALLLIVYFSLPYSGIVLSPFATGVLTLTLIEAAYLCEVFRSGIESIHKNQIESGRALGLTSLKTMRLIVLPQASRVVLPPYTNRMIGLMKRTAECSVIAIPEILQTARQVQSWYANATPLIIGAAMYMLVLFPMTKFSSYLESTRRRA